ncbi:MAG: cytochrome c oxidase subunit II [Acidimicrobiia bacterium]|nr:cytochrome c oxidase subunit II [Acidimicrobiia bacterium]
MPAAVRADRPRHHRRRTFALSLAASSVALLTLAAGASADLLTPESGGSSNADDIDTLYKLTLYVALVIFVGVEGALVYCLVKFRARKGQVAAQIRGNTRLEIGWTLGAAVVLVILAVVTFVQLDDIRNPPNSDPDGFAVPAAATVQFASSEQRLPPDGNSLNIQVNGQQYVWRYTYPDDDENVLNNAFAYTEMVVPTKTTVTLQINAQDVAHSWWIPALGGKFDALPGHTNYTWFKIDEPGSYTGQCAELCGRGHANMVASVRALPPEEFERWLASKQQEITRANELAQEQRQEIEGEQAQGDEAP